MTNSEKINTVVTSNSIEVTFFHNGIPSWTSETWERQENGHFKCVHEEASNHNFDASNKSIPNHDMVRYIKKSQKTSDCEIKFS